MRMKWKTGEVTEVKYRQPGYGLEMVLILLAFAFAVLVASAFAAGSTALAKSESRLVPYSQNSTEAELIAQVGDADAIRAAIAEAPAMDPNGCRCVVMLSPSPDYQGTPDLAKGVGVIAVDSPVWTADRNGTMRWRDGYNVAWDYDGATDIEVRVGAPDGPIFAHSPVKSWLAPTSWAKPGTWFYLQDVSGGKPLTRENTIAVAVIK